jgi:hypothetical protein
MRNTYWLAAMLCATVALGDDAAITFAGGQVCFRTG